MDENKFNEWYKKILEETDRKIKMNTEKLLEEMSQKNKKSTKKILEETDRKIKMNTEKLLEEMSKKNGKSTERILEEADRKIKMSTEKLLEEMKKRFDEVEQKRIQDTFYFEYTYGEKISAIFDKIQLMDDIKEIEDEENQKYKERFEHNNSVLMSHDFKISELEKQISSK